MNKLNFTVNYATDLFMEGNVTLPYILLRSYKILGVSEVELVLLQHIIAFRQLKNNYYPQPEELAELMTNDELTIKSYIASLIEKGLLSVEQKYDFIDNKWINIFNLNKLFDRLAENWALEQQQKVEKEEKLKNLNINIQNDDLLGELYVIFEKEFGRLLSPIEASQLSDWCNLDNFSPEMIKEALKRSVLRGITNFKYIDSILRDWGKNNIKNIQQIDQFEKRFNKKKTNYKKDTNQKKSSNTRVDKYKNVYLNRG